MCTHSPICQTAARKKTRGFSFSYSFHGQIGEDRDCGRGLTICKRCQVVINAASKANNFTHFLKLPINYTHVMRHANTHHLWKCLFFVSLSLDSTLQRLPPIACFLFPTLLSGLVKELSHLHLRWQLSYQREGGQEGRSVGGAADEYPRKRGGVRACVRTD